MTRFGKILRNLRMDNGELLKDMAEILAVSSSFLSAVENGHKKVPKNWVEIITNRYNLTKDQRYDLESAAEANAESVKINFTNATEQQRDLAFAFARRLNSLDEDTIKKIQSIMK